MGAAHLAHAPLSQQSETMQWIMSPGDGDSTSGTHSFKPAILNNSDCITWSKVTDTILEKKYLENY
jgi:hypothetical protein